MQERDDRGRGERWSLSWRLLAPVTLMGAIVLGWTGSLAVEAPSGSDKLLHAVFYGLLTAAWVFALSPWGGRRSTRLVIAFILAVGWGIVDEGLQILADHRTASGWDALANLVGALVAALVCLPLLRAGGEPAAALEEE